MFASRRFAAGIYAAVFAVFFLPVLQPLNAQQTNTPPPPAPAPPAPTPEQLAIQAASEKDHQRVMDELGIKSLRHGADGDPKSPNAANYDESKADLYTNIPDPLLLNNGKRVTTPAMWWHERRPQIVELFDREIYGRTPKNLPKVKWEVVSTVREKNGDVPVITKTLVGHVDNSADPNITVNIDLTLSTPADAKGPVPVIMELGFSKEFLAMLAKRFPQFAAMNGNGPTWQQQVLAKGWGYAEYIPTSVQPDNGAGLTRGHHRPGQQGPTAQTRRLGRIEGVGLGREPLPRLLRNRQGCRRETGRHRGPLALWQGLAGGDGLRSALRHRLHQLLGRGRREALPAHLRRAGGQRRRRPGVSLDGRKLLEVCRTADARRSAGRRQ